MKKINKTYRSFWKPVVLLCFFIGLWGTASAQISPSQYQYPQNHISWYTIESEHFLIHFQKGNSRSAKLASRIAEEVYPHITKLYDVEPDSKVSIILKDRQDYSNGAAYFFDNQINIWLPALDTPLRGTHDWLRNVISHEFTHIVQLQASMKKNRKIPAIYFQWLSYEDARRPDVLYGFPNGVISYPYASINVPVWFAEGVAQYQRSGWTFDTWDSHRDMLLRTSILHDTYLNFEEMGTFSSKNSLEREKAYNQGFAFVIYLVENFGESVLADISKALSKAGVHTADEALEMATGISGQSLFEDWITERTKFYKDATQTISGGKLNSIENNGFFNFHPTYSPDGTSIAYLSNKGLDESGLSLFIKSAKNSKAVAILNTGFKNTHPHTYSCGFTGKPSIKNVTSSFSLSPDGNNVVFARNKLNERGEHYNDLFVYNLKADEVKRLTKSQRLRDPSWSPDGSRIAAIQEYRGTKNLVLVDPEDGAIKKLTSYENGEQVYTPAWHPNGQDIFFASSNQDTRRIQYFDLLKNEVSLFLEDTYTDFRDPHVGPNGEFLYYSADIDGIFNIYKTPLNGNEKRKLSNVTGGAFMPNVNDDGEIIFAHYQKGGYKIDFITPDNITTTGSYQPQFTEPMAEMFYDSTLSSVNNFDNSEINSFSKEAYQKSDTAKVNFSMSGPEASKQRAFYAYDETFTGISFFPVLRFDNYSKLNGSNGQLIRNGQLGDFAENLYRDFKFGSYFSSREVIDRLTFFGGALFGPGSVSADGVGDFFSPARLTDLDRDLFFITEYQGLPFIKKRWSPTISIEFYNQRRNVKNGLSIEEFPCTSCLPDTLNADIAYNIWEADLFLRSKINDHNLVELGIGYTPYTVQTDGFFSRELNQFIPSSSDEYFRGTMYSATHIFERFVPYRHSDVAPVGLRTFTKFAYEPGRLLEDYVIENGTISPVYEKSKNHLVEFAGRYGFKISDRGTGQIYGRLFSYLNNPKDQFYLDYFGGLSGMRSYPFFALGGNTTAFAQASYIFPLFTRLNNQLGRHTLDKLFLRIFAEAGNGWYNSPSSSNFIKTGIGSELRFSFNSQYLFPLKLFISSAYGFNTFDVTLPSEFVTENSSQNVSYGNEVIFHFGLTFDFNIFQQSK
ncbi:MAG: hypothetical protein U5J95_13065 [Balneolaceae bacterium]|nr:hypothetical protein [Balneolaceae bacterium]